MSRADGWFTAQWEGGGLALIGLLISTAVLAGPEFWAAGLDEIAQICAVIAIRSTARMASIGPRWSRTDRCPYYVIAALLGSDPHWEPADG
ncbi:hypothetical protein ACQPXH_12895 [Nocardia sp. CA-135953]|uniref:hypothetical protein n=1 Tax=Nocardia sp. CA-135953 TaxID=3239978 RepID=UPI003D9651EE